MPTLREAILYALIALEHSGFVAGGAVFDDLAQALKDLDAGYSLEDKLSA